MSTNTTEQELWDKLSDLMADLMVDVSLKKLSKFDGSPIEKGRQYIKSHNDRLKLIMKLIAQYGDTREREGRIDERNKFTRWYERDASVLNVFGVDNIANGQYIRVAVIEQHNRERLAELKEES